MQTLRHTARSWLRSLVLFSLQLVVMLNWWIHCGRNCQTASGCTPSLQAWMRWRHSSVPSCLKASEPKTRTSVYTLFWRKKQRSECAMLCCACSIVLCCCGGGGGGWYCVRSLTLPATWWCCVRTIRCWCHHTVNQWQRCFLRFAGWMVSGLCLFMRKQKLGDIDRLLVSYVGNVNGSTSNESSTNVLLSSFNSGASF